MRTTAKRILIRILGVVFALCAFTGIGLSVSRTYAESGLKTELSSQVQNFYMLDGAEIRTNDPGIRFKARIKKTEWNALIDKYGEANVAMGMLVAPEDMLSASELVLDETKINDGTILNIEKLAFSQKSTDYYYIFNAVLKQIKDFNMDRTFVAKAYIRVVSDSDESVVYTDTAVKRTPVYVATAADAAGMISDDLKAEGGALQKYFDVLNTEKYIENNAGLVTSVENDTISLKQGEIYDFSAKYLDTDVVPVCESTNEEVAYVNGLKIYAEKEGETTVKMTVNGKEKQYTVKVDGVLDFYVRDNVDGYRVENTELTNKVGADELPVTTDSAWKITYPVHNNGFSFIRFYLANNFKKDKTYVIQLNAKFGESNFINNTGKSIGLYLDGTDVVSDLTEMTFITPASGSYPYNYEKNPCKSSGYWFEYTPKEDCDLISMVLGIIPFTGSDAGSFDERTTSMALGARVVGEKSSDVTQDYTLHQPLNDWRASSDMRYSVTEDSDILPAGENYGYRITNTKTSLANWYGALEFKGEFVKGKRYSLHFSSKYVIGKTNKVGISLAPSELDFNAGNNIKAIVDNETKHRFTATFIPAADSNSLNVFLTFSEIELDMTFSVRIVETGDSEITYYERINGTREDVVLQKQTDGKFIVNGTDFAAGGQIRLTVRLYGDFKADRKYSVTVNGNVHSDWTTPGSAQVYLAKNPALDAEKGWTADNWSSSCLAVNQSSISVEYTPDSDTDSIELTLIIRSDYTDSAQTGEWFVKDLIAIINESAE